MAEIVNNSEIVNKKFFGRIPKLVFSYPCTSHIKYVMTSVSIFLLLQSDIVAEDSYPARPAGLFSHLFTDAGIYEIMDGERPHLKCVLIVKPTPKQHVVKITKFDFVPGLLSCFHVV